MLALAVIAGILASAVFFINNGYLPDPFFNDVNDTFMDWYNPAYWSHHSGAYEFWGSVYPPMSFVFLRIFSVSSCYDASTISARSCDHVGVVVLVLLLFVNGLLGYLAFRRANISAALPRAIAVSFGLPMLFALERGNLIVPCFTAFILAYGRLLRSGWAKAACAAIAINFKPYLLIAAAGRIFRRDWNWAEAVVITTMLIYAASYAIIGEGSPGELLRDIIGFSGSFGTPSFRSLHFTTSYAPLRDFLHATPLMPFIGSQPIEAVEFYVPIVIKLSMVGTAVCLAGAFLLPLALPATRISSLVMVLYYVLGGPGGYTMSFVLFLLFLERWRGVSGMLLILGGYLWCIPWDYALYPLAREVSDSYLSAQHVAHNVNILLGDVIRPAFMLIIEFALLFTCARDLLVALLRSRDSVRAKIFGLPVPTGAA